MKVSAKAKQLLGQIAAAAPKISWKLVAVPTYSAADSVLPEEARAEFDRVFDSFLDATEEWNEPVEQDEEDDEQEDDAFLDFGEEHTEKPRPVHAACITTGTGKTERAAAKIARFIQDGKLKPRWSVLYLVPRHELGNHIEDLFRDLGVSAQVYRGRRADDPNPENMALPNKDRTKMCVEAEKCGKDISKACCRYKPRGGEERRCKFYDDGCPYQAQFPDQQPQVWIAAHEMLHYAQKRFGRIAFIIIDESFWKRGVSGVETHGDETRGITLEDMALDMSEISDRFKLIKILKEHPLGGLEHKRLSKTITTALCKNLISLEWGIVNSLNLTPQMSPAQIKKIEKLIPVVRTARRMVGVWGALRELLGREDVKISGRLILDENKAGQRVLKVPGVRPIIKS